MILVDTNVPMYLIGAEHPHKLTSQRMLERAAAKRERLVTDAEVFQEILHRYTAIGRRDAIQPAFDVLNAVIDEVFAIEAGTVERVQGDRDPHDGRLQPAHRRARQKVSRVVVHGAHL